MRVLFFRIAIFLIATCCYAQQPVAPTAEPVGPRRGDTWGDYNVVNSFETGYRYVNTSGNTQKYRSDVNYQDGIRLFDSFLSLNSTNGHGSFFDDFLLTTTGLGGDPYESATVRLEKNRLYQYDLLWRSNNYVNPGLTTDGGAGVHFLNTTNTLQDQNLILFPQSQIRFFLGYSRTYQAGPGISTVLLFQPHGQFDPTGDIFSPFANIHRVQNEYRVGGELHWHALTLNVLHGWQDFKDDTQYNFNGFSAGDIPNNSTSLTSYLRAAPYHGTSPYWRIGLFSNTSLLSVNARFTYTSGSRDFVSNETAIGTNQLGAAANQQIVTFGDARRPVGTGNVTVSLFPTSKLTLVNQTSIYNVRTDGNSTYLQFDNATQSVQSIYFEYLGIRTIATQTDLHYELTKWLDLHAGYDYANRKIASNSQFGFVGTRATFPYYQTNVLNSGAFGFQVRPLKTLNISVDDEIGRANRPFTPKGDKNYNVLVGRAVYKLKKLELMGSARADYNENSVTLSSYSSHARIYSASASWNARSWFGLNATFSKSHLDTLGGIAFFAQSQFLPNQVSYYVSNIYAGTLTARLSYRRADLFVGYSHVQDVGDGRSTATTTIVGPNIPAFQTAQTFPLTFQSPLARLSLRISERVRWNVGYQYYGYHERFFSGENYLANTGYTSLLWSF